MPLLPAEADDETCKLKYCTIVRWITKAASLRLFTNTIASTQAYHGLLRSKMFAFFVTSLLMVEKFKSFLSTLYDLNHSLSPGKMYAFLSIAMLEYDGHGVTKYAQIGR